MTAKRAKPAAPAPAAKKARKPAVKRARPSAGRALKGGGAFTINRTYRELPVKGGGVMRAEAGDYIVKDAKGRVSVKPPSVFRIEHPEG